MDIDNSLFYCALRDTIETKKLIEDFRNYSATKSKQVYILKNPLGSKKEYPYSNKNFAIILVPKCKIVLLNLGEKEDDFKDFRLDFIDDVAFLSEKFDYRKKLGRAREWSNELIQEDNQYSDFDEKKLTPIDEIEKQRKLELVISLLIGSINDIERVGAETPSTLLEKIKKKIILFDGTQSRFMYGGDINEPKVVIQGLAGTGKTELLLHKLKEIYISDTEKNSRIAFTCHNKVLANDMLNRIPNFFNFMKVEEQIEWNKRLFVFHAWGSAKNPYSGLYSYVCNKYQIPFYAYYQIRDFNKICEEALKDLNKINEFEPCFDYILVDESQDFGNPFFRLCEKIKRKQVYIAGDIFQNIFDTKSDSSEGVDFLLNKCYRTSPKTFMFAHAVGMGLCESPKINWLEDEDWRKCGYDLQREEKNFCLSRKPLRRFEDIADVNTIELRGCSDGDYSGKIMGCLDEIKSEHSDISPDDIAIIIISADYSFVCKVSDEVSLSIIDKYRWNSVKGHEQKEKKAGHIYISNINNIKGLEFSFVICVAPNVSKDIRSRNSMYMALTRSFLKSYLIANGSNETLNSTNREFIQIYQELAKNINAEGKLCLIEPSEEEKKKIMENNKTHIEMSERPLSNEEILHDIFDEYPELLNDDKKSLVGMFSSKNTKKKNFETSVRKAIEAIIETRER